MEINWRNVFGLLIAAVVGTVALLGGLNVGTGLWLGVIGGIVGIGISQLVGEKLPGAGYLVTWLPAGILIVIGALLKFWLPIGELTFLYDAGLLLLCVGIVALVLSFFGLNLSLSSLGLVLGITSLGVGLGSGNVLMLLIVGLLAVLVCWVLAELIPLLKGGVATATGS